MFERRDCLLIVPIAERRCRISQQATPLCTLDRAALEFLSKLLPCQIIVDPKVKTRKGEFLS